VTGHPARGDPAAMITKSYAITVKGRLTERFASSFERTCAEPAPEGRTRLLTEPFDQPQLHGLLDRLNDLGIELVRVEELKP
jgi:hypothetical protein